MRDRKRRKRLTLVDLTEDNYTRKFGLGIVGDRWVPGKYALEESADESYLLTPFYIRMLPPSLVATSL